MTELHQALYRFWQRLGLPVYLQGRAPDNAAFPFVTINVASPDAFGDTTLTAFVWLRDDGTGANARRAALMDEVKKLIPVDCVLLQLPGGYAELMRSQSNFLSYYDDPDPNTNVIGARVEYVLRLFCN